MSKAFIIGLAVIIFIVLAISIPNFITARSTSASNFYVNSLRQIDSAKNMWMYEYGKTTNDTPTWAQLLPFLDGSFTNFYATNDVVIRPAGGIYTIGRAGEPPFCLVNGQKVHP